MGNEDLFDLHKGNKEDRQKLGQKWSFSEIISKLESNSESSFPFDGISALKHMYGQQSHLIHADESALDLMLDRQIRADEELELLICSHVCCIFSDQVSLWGYSTSALRFRYDLKHEKDSNRWKLWKKLHSLIEPFSKRFRDSQEDHYTKWQG